MLTRIRVEGFKAIPPSGVKLELRPLTLLVGPTGSGKSSVLEAIALLAQSVRPTNKIQLETSGRLVFLSDPDRWPDSHISLLHRYDAATQLLVEADFGADREGPSERFGFSAAHFERQHHATFKQWLGDANDPRARVDFAAEVGGQIIAEIRLPDQPTRRLRVAGDLQVLLHPGLFVHGETHDLTAFRMVADRIAKWSTSSELRYIGAWHGVPALRSPDPRGDANASGMYGQHVLRLLAVGGQRGVRLRAAMNAAAAFGMPELHIGTESGLLGADFRDSVTDTRIRLDHAGAGSQQALPILADLYDLPPGGTLMVEEIERGSHPALMREWGRQLVGAASRGVQCIATTHAPDLVLACALAIKDGHGKPGADCFVAYDFRRDREGVHVDQLTVDARGQLSPGFPRSYRDAENDLLGPLLLHAPPPDDGNGREGPGGAAHDERHTHPKRRAPKRRPQR
jgi:hypothetical protein